MTTFISLAISDTMFPDTAELSKKSIAPEYVCDVLANGGLVSALNPGHASTIDVIQRKYGFQLPIPERAPKVVLVSGDSLIVLQAQLPRLAEGEKHSQETVEKAAIKFSMWQVK